MKSSLKVGFRLFSTTFVRWLCLLEGSAYARTKGLDVFLRRFLAGRSLA